MKPLPKRVWILGWISLFADVASEMVYPIIPIFMNQVLRAPVFALGAVEGIAESIVSFMKGFSGWHSDRTGKRVPYVQVGYGLSALGKPLIALAMSPFMVLAGRGVDRFGKGLRTTSRDALLADSVEKEDYGRAYGLHRTLDTAGAFLGGVVLLVLLWLMVRRLADLRTIFVIAVIPGAVSVLFTFLLKEAKKPEVEAGVEPGSLKSMPFGYWRALSVMILFGVANTSDTFLLLRATDLFAKETPEVLARFGSSPVGASLILTTLVYLLFNLTYVAFSYPAGLVSDRIGRWPVLAVGLVLYTGVYAGFGYGGATLMWVLFAVYGIFKGLTDGVGKALIADHSPKQSRGSALGLFYMVTGFATLGGNLVAGWLWDAHGPQTTFLFCAAVAGLAVVAIPLTAKMERAS